MLIHVPQDLLSLWDEKPGLHSYFTPADPGMGPKIGVKSISVVGLPIPPFFLILSDRTPFEILNIWIRSFSQ